VKAETVATHKGGMLAWLFQRITAVLIIVTLGTHLVFTHILSIGKIDYETIGERVMHGAYTAVDLILLAAGVYHALNGLRMVLMDYWFGRRKLAIGLNIVLWVVGIAAVAYGAWALWPWIGYTPVVK
jgi:succinate dehydrogenase hydrophobic membrane anchor protein